MSTENDLDRDKMGRFTPGRSALIDERIAETEQRLANTRAFLERIVDGENRTRDHISDMLRHIEQELQSLYAERENGSRNKVDQQEG